MSGLAKILLDRHFTVSGSDAHISDLTTELQQDGCIISYPQSADNITGDIDLVVYTAAIHPDNPELKAAVDAGIPTLTRAELLGQIMKNYHTAVNVAGTHGKTTTTSMITEILLAADADPTISVGGILNSIGGNIRVGRSDLFVTEACEYTNSFLHFFPKIGIILNVEEDHMDFFKDIDDIRNSFHQFAALLPADGALVINQNIEGINSITDGLDCKIITYSERQPADYSASEIRFDEIGNASFDLLRHGEYVDRITLIAVCEQLEIPLDIIKKGILSFTGTDRRFQYKGERDGVTIIDDYAHHPTEIRATLTSAQNYPHKDIWCIFQPHTYTRTKAFFDEFAEALSLADHVVLADIYAARETDTLGMSSAALTEKIKELGTDAYYFPSFENFVSEKCIHGDLLITMGAGDVVNIGEALLK